jgi:hypothetical protein
MALNNQKLDDNAIQNVVTYSMQWAQGEMTRTSIDSEVLGVAWLALKDQRRSTSYSGSLELAAAEHYMYAAYEAARSGDPSMQLAPKIYELKKKLYFLVGQEERLRTDPRFPVVPPNDDIVAWGEEGARFGLDVYRKAHPGQSFQYGAAVGGLMSDAGYGKRSARWGDRAARKLGTAIGKYLYE